MLPSDKTVYRIFLLKKIVYPEQYRIKWKKGVQCGMSDLLEFLENQQLTIKGGR